MVHYYLEMSGRWKRFLELNTREVPFYQNICAAFGTPNWLLPNFSVDVIL